MQYISLISSVPLRSEPTSKSEKVTELLFGETCTLLEKQDEWALVKCDHDDYQGFISLERVELKTETHTNFTSRNWHFNAIAKSTNGIINIPFGALIPNNGTFHFQGKEFTIEANKTKPSSPIEAAKMYRNAPYSWGGRSSFGIDCSGLMQQIFLILDTFLPRDASQQALIGETISYEDRKEGNLAYFATANGVIGHVGILSSKDSILHAAGFVREDVFTEQGIFRTSEGKLTHNLAFIKRVG